MIFFACTCLLSTSQPDHPCFCHSVFACSLLSLLLFNQPESTAHAVEPKEFTLSNDTRRLRPRGGPEGSRGDCAGLVQGWFLQ